jgi:hypothetical protein
MRIDGSDDPQSIQIEPPPPPPPPPPEPVEAPFHASGEHPVIDDGVDAAAEPEVLFETAPPPAQDVAGERVQLTPAEQLLLQQSGASTLLTEDAGDDQVNCLDRAVDAARALPPGERQGAELVLLADARPGAEGRTGHVVLRAGDEVIDPASNQRYASTEAYLAANPQYRETGAVAADKAIGIFDTAAGSPERARALADADVPEALRSMLVADPGGGYGDRSLAARVKVEGPGIIPNRAESEAAGRQDGESLRNAIDAYTSSREPNGRLRQAMIDEMGKLRAHRDDPAYAAALIDTVGADRLKDLALRDPMNVPTATGDGNASLDGPIEDAREGYGDLFNAFYVADKSGMLSPQIRQDMLNLPANELGKLLRLGPFEGDFVRDAAHRILDTQSSPTRDAGLHDLLLSYPDPHLVLELAGNEKYAKAMFEFSALHHSRHNGEEFTKTLVSSLGAAFYAEPPGSPAHQAAMANMIELAKDDNFKRELAGSPELSQMLAKHFAPYMEGAGYVQAKELAERFEGLHIPPPGGPMLPPGIEPNEVANFFGGLVQHKDVYEQLLGKASDLMKNGNLARMFADPTSLQKGLTETTAFQSAAIADLGEISLIMQGIKSAGLDHDKAVEALADVLGNYGLGILVDKAGPLGSAFAQDKLKPAITKLADHIIQNGGQHDLDFQKYNDEVRELFSDAFRDSLVAANDKLPPDQRLDQERIVGMVNNFEAYFDSSVLSQIEEVFRAHKD